MTTRRKVFVAAGAAAVLVAFGGVAVAAGGGDDATEGDDVAITGSALEKASRAALDHVGEGRVTDTEVDDEESYYEVEVTLDDGRQIDVQLDRDFDVVGDEYDTAGEGDVQEESDRPEAGDDEAEGAEDETEDEVEGPDEAITGEPLAEASARALAAVQEELGQSGTVTDTEVGDEESYYEVEVTLDDGRQIDVQLDENFDFVGFD